MREKKSSANFLILQDFQNEYYVPSGSLVRGISTSSILRTLKERFLPRFDNKKLSVLDSLVNLERKTRSVLQMPPRPFDHKILKKKIKKFNEVIKKYNKIVKSPDTFERKEIQKKLLNDLHKLSYGNRREPLFPKNISRVIKQKKC